MPFDQFYKAMQDGATTKTSQINADEFTEYFEGFLKEGKDILHVCLSSGITGVVNSANIAREELSEKYPDRKILIVDSLGASSGYGLLMDRLADLRDEGKTIEEVYQWAEAHKLNLHHWFFSTFLPHTNAKLILFYPSISLPINGNLINCSPTTIEDAIIIIATDAILKRKIGSVSAPKIFSTGIKNLCMQDAT